MLGAGAVVTLGGAPAAQAVQKVRPGRLGYPFLLGVASGDPLPDSVILWTRLALDPLAADGLAGMPDKDVKVEFQVAEDPGFGTLVKRGTKKARVASAHSVHVELNGLEPGREYFYRFRVDEHISPVGRTVTAPAPGTTPAALRTGVVSCAQFEHGFFTAYARLAEDMPDLVLHLGDYIYEYAPHHYVIQGGNARDHEGPETTTLAGYRQRHAQYKSDPDLQAAHAIAPWAVVFDDHEVENNWAGDTSENDDPVAAFRARRAVAFQAYYENMPLRRAQTPKGSSIQAYRRLQWASLATFHILDTRQFRDDQASGDGLKPPTPVSTSPARSIMGQQQERWLHDGLRRSDATWDVFAQQVFFAQSNYGQGPTQVFNMDAWDGYSASRQRVLDSLPSAHVANPVVLTGDIHASFANELKADFDDTSSATVGVELVTTSITSGGSGTEIPAYGPAVMAENPHIKFAGNRRGYVLATYTATELRADFRSVKYVNTPGAPAYTQKSYVVEAGSPGLNAT